MKKLNAIFAVFLFTFLSANVFAQVGLNSSAAYGGSENDFAFDLAVTPDGGYIIAGHSESIDDDVTDNNGMLDFWIVKTDAAGNIEWQNNYGGSDNEFCSSVALTDDGGYVLAGTTISTDGDITLNHGGKDGWLVKINSTGGIVWQKTYGGTENDEIFKVIETSEGGLLATGYSKSPAGGDIESNNGNEDVWLIKTDADGNVEWTKNYGGSYNEELYSVIELADGFMVAGFSKSNDLDISGNHEDGASAFSDFLVMSLDLSGDVIWQKCYGGFKDDDARCIIQSSTGNFIVTGSEKSADGDVTEHYGDPNRYDFWLIEIDADGTLLNQNNFGGSKDDQSYSVVENEEGHYFMAGQSSSSDLDVTGHHGASNTDFWVAEADASLGFVGNVSLGGTNDDVGQKIVSLGGGLYAAVGFTKSFDVDVTDHHGVEGNQDFWLALLGPCSFSIDAGPDDITTCEGSDIVLSVDVTGSATEYSWVFIGGPTVGTSGPSLSVSDVTTAYSHNYYVIGTGPCGSDTSETATLEVTEFATPDVSPAGPVDICATGSVDLSTALTGAGYTYQWYADGVEIPGATDLTYTATAAGTYFVEVSNPDGCAKPSANVIVTSTGPVATVTLGGSANICATGSVTLTTISGAGYVYQWFKDGGAISGAASVSYTATTTGSYYVIVSVSGCASTSATTVVTDEGPGASIIAGGNLDICLTGSVSLSSTTPGTGLAYQWIFNDAPLSGAVGVSILASDTGFYKLEVSNLSGCKDTSAALKVFNSCAAIQTLNEFADIILSPNPSNGLFNISLHSVDAAGKIFIEVTDIKGEKVFEQLVPAEKEMLVHMDLQNIPAGNYILKMTNNEAVMIRQLVINH